MNKTDVGMGAGMVLLMAVCCGGKLILLAFATSGVAIFTGQTLVIAAAAVLLLVAIGLVVWRRRASGCAVGSCPPPTDRADALEREPSASPATRALVSASTMSPPTREQVQR